MVGTQLTPELIREGAALVEALDKAGESPDAALWFYSPEGSRWELMLADVRLGPEGPRKVYRAVQKALHSLRHEITHVSLEDVTLAKPDAPVIKGLARAVATRPGINGIRVTLHVVNGTLIDDAYIYRLKRPAA
jgi:hypothetical protein